MHREERTAASSCGTRPAPADVVAWARMALPDDLEPARHQAALLDALADVEAGRCDRLMVLMPPGSAKSTYCSVLFPPWWFSRRPRSHVIACAHTASLAGYFGARVRGLVEEHGDVLDLKLLGRRARHEFSLSSGGSYYAVGVRGAVTGRRADLILIDDPIRSHVEADSEWARDALWDWYRMDLLTRLKPGGRVVLIMTRWHEDDLVGRLLAREADWRCLRYPALAEADDPLGRAQGDALWPEWEDEASLDRKRGAVGEKTWAALYQQAPRPQSDPLFASARIDIVETAEPVRCARGWDLAATTVRENRRADWTAGVKIGREASGRFVVMDVARVQRSAYEVESFILSTARSDGNDTIVGLPQDPGQAGKHQVQQLTALLAGFRVRSSCEVGSKVYRAGPAASQANVGNLVLLRGPWNASLLDEIRDFPNSRTDDQVDALARAFNCLCERGTESRRATVDLVGR
jgi:predicted phage terminase large subunit-like protein